jgi:K+-transporting ATPase A subunit
MLFLVSTSQNFENGRSHDLLSFELKFVLEVFLVLVQNCFLGFGFTVHILVLCVDAVLDIFLCEILIFRHPEIFLGLPEPQLQLRDLILKVLYIFIGLNPVLTDINTPLDRCFDLLSARLGILL